MKKFAGISAAGLGLLAAGFAAPSQAAAPETHISGNFQYTSMSYWCDYGMPNFVFSFRTLNKTESKVTFSASGYRDLVTNDVSPYTASQTIYSLSPTAGAPITVHAVGSTTGSSFNVSGKIPSSCKGLPSTEPTFDWASQGKPTAQSVPSSTSTTPAPTKTTPAPTKSSTSAPTSTTPAPSKTTPAPTKSSTSSTTTVTPTPTKSSPAPVTTTTAPSTSMPTAPTSGKGPKVDTDRVATNNDTALYAMAAGAGAIALAGAGTVAARRRK